MISLLIIEDNPDHRELIAANLLSAPKDTFDLSYSGSLRESMEYLKDNNPDLILLDLSLPDSYLKDTLPKAIEIAGTIPIIVLTSLDDRDTLMDMIRQGAKDCIPKTMLRGGLLERSIKFCLDREIAIQEQMKTELELQQVSSFQGFYDKSPVGFFVMDGEGTILNSNPFFSNLIKFSSDKLVGKSAMEFIPRNWVQNFESAAKEITSSISSINFMEIQLRNTAGKEIWTNISLQKIAWVGKDDCILVSVYDTSAIKQAEEKAFNAQTKAESANKAKSALIRMLGHDLRSPVANIISNCDFLNNVKIEEDAKDCLASIQSSANHLLNLIDDILQFSNVESGNVVIKLENCDVEELVCKITENFQKSAVFKNIALTTDFHLTAREFPIDKNRVSQILENLLSNAIKFTQNNGTIRVNVQNTRSNISFSIMDSGIGISEEEKDRLFTPYTQANESIQKKYGGTGLGLSICKNLANLMNGSIELKSTLGKGSEFTLHLSTTASNQ